MASPTLGAMIAAMGNPVEWGAISPSFLCWDNANGYLGIGTSSPAYMLHIRKDVDNATGPILCLQNSTYTNSTGAQSVLRFQNYDSSRYSQICGTAYGSYGQPYAIMLGMTDPSDTYRTMLNIYYDGTMISTCYGLDGVSGTGYTANCYQKTTGSTSMYTIALMGNVQSLISSGYTQSGYTMGIRGNTLRYDQGGSVDKGTLVASYGGEFLSGHYGSEGTKTTNSVYGVAISTYYMTGTVGAFYALSFGYAGGGTLTNTSYYIYASDGVHKMYRGGSTTWDSTSDSAIKKDIKPYTKGLDLIRQINIKSFKYNGKFGMKDTETERIGILADELAPIIPEACYKTKHTTHVDNEKKKDLQKQGKEYPMDEDDGEEYWGYNIDRVHFSMINAVKELDERLSKVDKKSFADPNAWQ